MMQASVPDTQVRTADLNAPRDATAVIELLDAYATDAMGDGQGLQQETRDRLIPALRQVPGAVVLLAWARERAVGLAICFPGFSTFQARPLLNIHDLAVLPDQRSRGIGSALLTAAEAEARRRGCCKLTLEVREDNPPAQGLYRKLGFGAGKSGEQEIQYLFLEKRL